MKTKTFVILIMTMFIMTSGIQKSNAENLYDFTVKTQSGKCGFIKSYWEMVDDLRVIVGLAKNENLWLCF